MTPAVTEKILIVEDEPNLGETLKERLEKEGYWVDWVTTKEDAIDQLLTLHYDLVILDVGLPDGNGFEVAKSVRNKKHSTSILFLTAFNTAEDRIRGLELGAEDYVAKPFHLKELLLRVRNVLKRHRPVGATADIQQVKLGRAMIRFDRYEAQVGDYKINLSQKECSLLKLLVERAGQVVSRDEILDSVWAEGEYPTTRTVDNFVMRLRRILEEDPDQPMIIKSVRGVGYQLTLPEEEIKQEEQL